MIRRSKVFVPAAEVVSILQRMREFMRMATAKSYDALDPDTVNVRSSIYDLADCCDIVVAYIVVVIHKSYKQPACPRDQRIALCSDRRLAIVTFVQNLDLIL